MARSRHIGLFGVGECFDILSNYPAQWPDGSGDIPVGDGNPYPLQLSLYNAMRFFWGPKKWRVSFDYEFERDISGSETGPTLEEGSYIKTNGIISLSGESGDENSIGNSNYIHNGAPNESYLFCRAEDPEAAVFRYSWSFPITHERRIIKIVNGNPETTDDTIIINRGCLLWTNFDYQQKGFASNFVKSEDQSIENLWVAFGCSVPRYSSDYEFGNIAGQIDEFIDATLIFLGEEYPIKMGARSITDEKIIKFEISNVVIEPTEWWSYDDLFDTATGEKIGE